MHKEKIAMEKEKLDMEERIAQEKLLFHEKEKENERLLQEKEKRAAI